MYTYKNTYMIHSAICEILLKVRIFLGRHMKRNPVLRRTIKIVCCASIYAFLSFNTDTDMDIHKVSKVLFFELWGGN